jgi:hypothetical protein
MSSAQWVLELVLTLLLGATLFYALRLERTIRVLQSDRIGLGDVLLSIRTALDDADRGIQTLRNVAEHTSRALTLEIETARQAQEDMRFLLDRLEHVASRVETAIKSGRAAASVEEPKTLPAPAHSKAERDLLKVLRLSK